MSSGLFVIKTSFLLTGVAGNTVSSLPENYSLSQNYPNPFNPSTTIKFSLKENSLVKLNVYDLQGREVASVVNDRRDGGNYEIAFDASNFNLSSGTYFYNIQVQGSTSDFTETKKMFLIK